MMEEMDKVEVDTFEDIVNMQVNFRFRIQFSNLQGELWVTAEEYEKKLERDIKGYQIEKMEILSNINKKMSQIKSKYLFYIESLEVKH